jgi:hypothetical protein
MDAKCLPAMSRAELDALFGAHESGPIADGGAEGTAIIATETQFSDAVAARINIFARKDKVFDAKDGFLRNEILPFGLVATVRRVYKVPSLNDRKDASCSTTRRRRSSPCKFAAKLASSTINSISAGALGTTNRSSISASISEV